MKGENGLPQPFTRLRNDETVCHSERLRERIRNTLSEETDCRAPYGGLACRLGRCFCFAEVSTGHPHRNDRATVYCTPRDIHSN